MDYLKGIIFGAFAAVTVIYLHSISKMQDGLSEQIRNVDIDVTRAKLVLDDLNSIGRQAQ